jgi:hypothetical protein
MCFFLTIGIPKADKPGLVAAFSRKTISECQNESLLRIFGAGIQPYWVTDGHCSCSFYSAPTDYEAEIEKVLRKAGKPKSKKKGWSPARIEQKIEALREKAARDRSGLAETILMGIRNTVAGFGACHVLLHPFRGLIDSEGVDPPAEKTWSLSYFMAAAGGFQVDELYRIVPDKAAR